MKILFAAQLLSLLFSVNAITDKDACHVYVVDVAKARRALSRAPRTDNEDDDQKVLSVGQTIFPEFRPTLGEEELTTKHYPFPGARLVITASVFYTDESMASHGHGEFVSESDSVLLGLAVAQRPKLDAIAMAAGDNAIAEVTDDQYTNKVRVEKYVKVGGRIYLVGLECDCMADKRPR